MSIKNSIKPISYLKANAAKVIKDVSENGKTLYITQNGEAKVVVQDIKEYEKIQDTLALLKILQLGEQDIKKGNYKTSQNAFSKLDKRIKKFKGEL